MVIQVFVQTLTSKDQKKLNWEEHVGALSERPLSSDCLYGVKYILRSWVAAAAAAAVLQGYYVLAVQRSTWFAVSRRLV